MIDERWITRFNAKWLINPDNECWEWFGAKIPKGYGIIKIPGSRKYEYAHRLSYRIHCGEIPEGAHVLHRCDNPKCVNPEHLFLGSSHDNHVDMVQKDRHLYGERNKMAKLTVPDVMKIKSMLALGVPQSKIAGIYGVGQMTISRIHQGKRWAHIRAQEVNSDMV